jgi:putative heme-binding domain-containing protein
MNVEAVLAEAKLLGNKPVQGDLGLPDARVIAPGDPHRSVLLYRMTTAGRGHMPYLGGKLVDDHGVLLIRNWIESLRPERDAPAPVQQQGETERESMRRLKTGDASLLDELLASSSGSLTVALAVIDGSLTRALREQAVAKGSALADPLRRDLFERFLPPEQRRKTLGPAIDAAALLALKGDVARGKAVFLAMCAACHRAGESGIDFGPDLSRIATKYDRAALLDQILHPAKVIEAQWQLTTVTLKNGETLSGFIAARTGPDVSLRLAGGATKNVSAADIARTSTERISLMPEGLLQSLTAQEAADLLAFMISPK